MKKLKLSEILSAINLKLTIDDCLIDHVSNDIDAINDNSVIFYLNKDKELNVDNYKKLRNCYIISDQPVLKTMGVDLNHFYFIQNVDKAYKEFIGFYRSLFNIPVVAITGTCGKTTTKEMISQVLKNDYKIVSTAGNKNALGFNNDYLMSIDEKTEFGVFETAISYPGNLITGCEFFKPTIGIITTIGVDHLNGFKSINNYIRAKGEMLAGLQYKGKLIINNDDENIKKINFKPYQGTIITFGINNESDFYAFNIKYSDNGMNFILKHNNKNYQVAVPGFGEHIVYNALAALAALTNLQINLNESIKYLARFKNIRSHLEFHQGIENSTIIDDTWSSNPTSMKAALKVLSDFGQAKIKIAVIGKISYLGDHADYYYKEIAKMLIEYKVDFLITSDIFAKQIGKYAVEYGFDKNRFIHSSNKVDVKSTLESLLDENTIILFKISMLDQSLSNIMKELIKEKSSS